MTHDAALATLAEPLPEKILHKTKICCQCGAAFTQRRRNQLMCSPACQKQRIQQKDRESHARRRAKTREQKGLMTKLCDQCGTPFIPARSNSFTCSSACSIARNRAQTNAQQARPTQPCVECGVSFIPKNSLQLSCSRVCARARQYSQTQAKKNHKQKQQVPQAKQAICITFPLPAALEAKIREALSYPQVQKSGRALIRRVSLHRTHENPDCYAVCLTRTSDQPVIVPAEEIAAVLSRRLGGDGQWEWHIRFAASQPFLPLPILLLPWVAQGGHDNAL